MNATATKPIGRMMFIFAVMSGLALLSRPAASELQPPAPGLADGTDRPPAIRLHYLGHSSFIFRFDNGVTLLADYGKSNAYGLDSPVYDAGTGPFTAVLYSHHHPDHDRGQVFAGARLIDGGNASLDGVEIRAIRVTENQPEDNFGYLITYRDFTIFYAGDSQGDMAKIKTDEQIRARLRRMLPPRIDLLLLPAGWTRGILAEAAAYLEFIRPCRAIPMHYWSPREKEDFLELLRSTGYSTTILQPSRPYLEIAIPALCSPVQVISLQPGPWIQ